MTQSEFDNKAKEIISTVASIDEKTKSLLGSDLKLFGETSLPLIGAHVNEAAFIRMVSYLYVLYYELGKNSLEFLIKEYITQHIRPNIYEDDPRKIIHSFRTFFHHNLLKINNEDLRKIEHCKSWFQVKIGKDYPLTNLDWSTPLESICNEANLFLLDIEKAIDAIKSIETSDLYINAWRERAFNSYTVYSFEKICTSILPYFSLEALNSNDFCKKRIQQWIKELSYLNQGFNFENEAAKLIERDIINYVQEETKKIPITGKEIMEYLNLDKPSKIIGILLKKCKEKYESSTCKKEDLLAFSKELYESMDK